MELKAQQLIVLLVSMFIFTLGFGIIVPVFGYLTKDMGASALDLGLLMATMSAMQFLCAPTWGKLSDKIGRKPVMLIGLFGFALSFILTGFSTQLWMLFAAQIIGGLLSAGIWPAVLAYVTDISSPEERGKLMGFMGAASGLGIIVGPAISSILASWGLTVPFFAAAGIALVTLVMSVFLLPESLQKGKHIHKGPKVALLDTLKTPLGAVFFIMLLVSFAGACLDGTAAYFIMDKFSLTEQASSMPVLNSTMTLTGPNVMGIIFTVMGIVSVVSQLAVGPLIQKYGEKNTMVFGLILVAAGMICMPFSIGLASLVLTVCVMGIGMNLVNPAVNTLVSKQAPPDRIGAMMGLLGSFNSVGRVLGPSVGGAAYMISMTLPYIGSAVVAAGCAGAMALMGKRLGAPGESESATQ
ncbi:MFS transporter [Methanocella sp. MCL-LM]|uniref:MFS transporter n=1 Tax=Methanocella sp. MCL-LM TaxID=3412035 RepID=UPI003C766581